MTKTTFENLKKILTSNHPYAAGTYYSVSLCEVISDDWEYRSIDCFPSNSTGSFHDGFARFFVDIASVLHCSCSFKSQYGVCVAHFY